MVHSCTFVLEIELTVKYEIEYKNVLVAGSDKHVEPILTFGRVKVRGFHGIFEQPQNIRFI